MKMVLSKTSIIWSTEISWFHQPHIKIQHSNGKTHSNQTDTKNETYPSKGSRVWLTITDAESMVTLCKKLGPLNFWQKTTSSFWCEMKRWARPIHLLIFGLATREKPYLNDKHGIYWLSNDFLGFIRPKIVRQEVWLQTRRSIPLSSKWCYHNFFVEFFTSTFYIKLASVMLQTFYNNISNAQIGWWVHLLSTYFSLR